MDWVGFEPTTSAMLNSTALIIAATKWHVHFALIDDISVIYSKALCSCSRKDESNDARISRPCLFVQKIMRKRRSFVDYFKKIVQPFVSLLRLSSRNSHPPLSCCRYHHLFRLRYLEVIIPRPHIESYWQLQSESIFHSLCAKRSKK
jgi:hypothetical protein